MQNIKKITVFQIKSLLEKRDLDKNFVFEILQEILKF